MVIQMYNLHQDWKQINIHVPDEASCSSGDLMLVPAVPEYELGRLTSVSNSWPVWCNKKIERK